MSDDFEVDLFSSEQTEWGGMGVGGQGGGKGGVSRCAMHRASTTVPGHSTNITVPRYRVLEPDLLLVLLLLFLSERGWGFLWLFIVITIIIRFLWSQNCGQLWSIDLLDLCYRCP